jgi:hypothetical protein
MYRKPGSDKVSSGRFASLPGERQRASARPGLFSRMSRACAAGKLLTHRWVIAVRYFRQSLLMAWALFGAFSCAGGDRGADRPESGLSKPTRITCQGGPDCDAKWARANKWVTAGLKIQSKAESQIKTVDSRDGNSRTLVVTITKNATSKPGTYEISFVGGCPSQLGCVPPIAESRAGFVNFVLGQRFHGSNHIRQPRRAYRTRCG